MSDEGAATVFVVDDDEGVRQIIVDLVKTVGLKSQTFENGDDFLSAYKSTIPGCVILDVRMPGTSGLDIQKELQDQPVPPPVIVLTGYGDIPMTVEAMRTGAHEFVEKPFRAQDLLDSIQNCIRVDSENRERHRTKTAIVARLDSLTERERTVLEMVVNGLSNKEIARALDTSPRTVEVQRMRMMKKMEASSIAGLVQTAIDAGIQRQDP
ncbi:MAG: response regulator [Proteobacteria bacterium]|nr:response regulator [Pseudomonadota bacterium]MDA1057441.1 response regulator [Pseudomonadota bacterium]